MKSLGRTGAVQVVVVLLVAVVLGAAIAGSASSSAGDAVRVTEQPASATTSTSIPLAVTAVTLPSEPTESGSPSISSSPADEPDIRVSIIGDEWTSGVAGVGGEGANSWAGLVEQELRDEGLTTEFQVATVPQGGYARPGSGGITYQDLVADVISPETQTVIVFGSRNDFGLPQDAIAEGARATFQQIRNLLPTVPFVVVGPVGLPTDNASDVANTLQILGIVAAEYEATFVDPSGQGWFAGATPDLVAGGEGALSPTDAGHALLASFVVGYIVR